MGILLIVLIIGYKSFKLVLTGILTKKFRKAELSFITLVSIATTGIFAIAFIYSKKFLSVFEGLPIFSNYAHSASIRLDDFLNTWQIFQKSPLIGYSLGGIAPAIAKMKGYGSLTQEVVKNTEGMSVLLEILAASGIIGFFFFMRFLLNIFTSGNKLKKISNVLPDNFLNDYLYGHRFLLSALIAQLILLSLNQNILRNYFWIHLANVNLSFFSLKDAYQLNKLKQNE
jgi:O-antigen ligase